MQHLEGLNEAQRQAVTKTEGPLLVLAGAGAGKTKTITHRILHLIKNGVAPEEILAVTFTNKAAREMKERIEHLLRSDNLVNQPISITGSPFISTFHSLGVHIIKEHSGQIGLTKYFSIFDRGDSKKAIKDALEKWGYNPKEFEPGKILGIISKYKGDGVDIEEFSAYEHRSFFEEVVYKVWQTYKETLQKENALDFDDLLLVTAKILKDEKISSMYARRWRYIHIDEYQDTNKVQYEIAESIAKHHQNICVVGDIDQTIYSWRGANIRNILNFEKDYRDARVVILEENYRSTQTILAVANRIIEKNKFRKEKILVTKNGVGEKIGVCEALSETHESQFVVQKIEGLRSEGVPLSEIAVLYRANFQSRALEEQFLASQIPYHVLGTKFFERKEVKDILSYLRLAMNPKSIVDLKRVINTPARGIGKTTLLKIVEGKEDALPPAMKIKLNNFNSLISRIREVAQKETPSRTLLYIAEESGILREFGKSEEDQERVENIKELVALSKRYDQLAEGERIEKFIEETSLLSDQDSDEKGKDGVRLMTVHASKGLEFAYVFITGLEEGLFPHNKDEEQSSEDSEEERRLFYVAITRAKKKLFMTYAQSRTIFGSQNINIPSEFLLEIPDEYLEREFSDYRPRRKSLLDIEF